VTTIFEAIDREDSDAALGALRADPSVARTRHESGVTPVLYAMYHHRFALARELAGAAGDLDLHEAATVDDAGRVRALLTGGAPVEERTGDGFTPLQLAAYFGAPGAASVLLDAGADVHARSDNPMRIQPLHAAAAGRHSDVAALLIAAGADVRAAQSHGYTPLHSAVQNGDAALVDALLAAGADRYATTDDGRTPAQVATEAGHADLAARLA